MPDTRIRRQSSTSAALGARAGRRRRVAARPGSVDLEQLGRELRKGVTQVRGELAAREAKLERQGRDLARALVRQLRLSAHRQLSELGKRFSALEKQAEKLERRLR